MWKITYEEKAQKDLSNLDKVTQKRILKSLIKIAQDPKLFGKSLQGGLKGLRRYRVGDYRIICNLEEKKLIILVLTLGHRKNIYK